MKEFLRGVEKIVFSKTGYKGRKFVVMRKRGCVLDCGSYNARPCHGAGLRKEPLTSGSITREKIVCAGVLLP